MTDGGIDPVPIGVGIAAAAKALFSFARGDIKPCTTRPEWTGIPYLSDKMGYHPLPDGRFHHRLMQKGLIRVMREAIKKRRR